MDPEILYSRHHPRSHHRLQDCRLNHHHYHHRRRRQKNVQELAGRCLLDWGHHWLFVFYQEAFWMHSLLLLRQKKIINTRDKALIQSQLLSILFLN